MHIDPFWSAGGRAAAERHGFTFGEVVAVLDAVGTVQVHGPDSIIYLGGTPGRVMVVTADREHRNIAAYRITDVRPATPGEAVAWEKRQS